MKSKLFKKYDNALKFYESLKVSYKRLYKDNNGFWCVKWFEFEFISLFI